MHNSTFIFFNNKYAYIRDCMLKNFLPVEVHNQKRLETTVLGKHIFKFTLHKEMVLKKIFQKNFPS